MTDIPGYEPDIFDEAAQLEPYGHYRALRELGPVVWLAAHDLYAFPRYAQVRAALSDPVTYRSGAGVGMNDVVNTVGLGTTLMSDGDLHDHLRGVVAGRLTPRALRPRKGAIEALAEEIVDKAVARGSFDAVVDLARALPLSFVPDLVGWPLGGREHLLEWASAAFDILGPLNERAQAALPGVQAMVEFAGRTAAAGDFIPGGLGAGLIDAAARGELEPAQVPNLVIDYIAPSLDTTISGIGSVLWLLGQHPERWAALRADRGLIPGALNEALRMESPIRSFTRVTTTDTVVADHLLPEGSRVLMMFASANRDERRWDRPEEFDITRADAAEHLAFSYGTHGCAGQGLARLESHAMLSALADRVESFEIGEPVRAVNNLIRSLASLPMTVTPARVTA